MRALQSRRTHALQPCNAILHLFLLNNMYPLKNTCRFRAVLEHGAQDVLHAVVVPLARRGRLFFYYFVSPVVKTPWTLPSRGDSVVLWVTLDRSMQGSTGRSFTQASEGTFSLVALPSEPLTVTSPQSTRHAERKRVSCHCCTSSQVEENRLVLCGRFSSLLERSRRAAAQCGSVTFMT